MDTPEKGEMRIIVDMDWTIEAIMNLMKNCIERARQMMIAKNKAKGD